MRDVALVRQDAPDGSLVPLAHGIERALGGQPVKDGH
jgi:hypothetical protein